MAFYYTSRGIPMVYYGTEILMTGEEHKGHGYIREDFPGGWEGDATNAFSAEGLSADQVEAQAYVKHLQNWRQQSSAVHNGKLIHFIPENGVYVYFRLDENETLMIVMNNNSEIRNMPNLDRFNECLKDKRKAFEVTQQKEVDDISTLSLPPKSTFIFEIK